MALPILSRIFFVLWGLVALKKPDLVWKMEFCKIDEPSESYLPPCRSSSFAKAASQISNLALRSRVCGSGTNSQLKNQHISVIFQPYLHSEMFYVIQKEHWSYRHQYPQCLLFSVAKFCFSCLLYFMHLHPLIAQRCPVRNMRNIHSEVVLSVCQTQPVDAALKNMQLIRNLCIT